MSRCFATALVATLALALAGCGSVSTNARDRSLAALRTQDPKPLADLPDLKGTPACGRHEYRSLKPGSLPTPGHMPRGTFMRTIQRRGHLVVGVDQNSLGLGYLNPASGRMEGFDIDVVREVARAIFGRGDPDRHILYKAIATPQRVAAIRYRKVDIVASAFSINCERRRRVRFSSVYHRARQRLLVPEDSHVRSLDDLRGQPVCATSTSTTVERLKRVGALTYPVDLRSDCLAALQERVIAAVSADDSILLGLCQQDRQTKIVGPTVEGKEGIERYGLAMDRRRTGFTRFVNAVLERVDLDTLRTRWLGALPVTSNREIRRCRIPGA
jgi:polar amino acid transport system substrate-binding protein